MATPLLESTHPATAAGGCTTCVTRLWGRSQASFYVSGSPLQLCALGAEAVCRVLDNMLDAENWAGETIALQDLMTKSNAPASCIGPPSP